MTGEHVPHPRDAFRDLVVVPPGVERREVQPGEETPRWVGELGAASCASCVGRPHSWRRMEQRQRGVVRGSREFRRRLAQDRAEPVRIPQGVCVERVLNRVEHC